MHFSPLLGGIPNESAHYLGQKRAQINFLLLNSHDQSPPTVPCSSVPAQYGTFASHFTGSLLARPGLLPLCLSICPCLLISPYPASRESHAMAMALHIKSRTARPRIRRPPLRVGNLLLLLQRLVSLRFAFISHVMLMISGNLIKPFLFPSRCKKFREVGSSRSKHAGVSAG